MQLGRGDRRYPRLLRALTRADLLILDDWGPDRLGPDERRDLLEIFEDRYDNASILITSQLPLSGPERPNISEMTGGLTTDKLQPPGSRQSDSSTSGIANGLIRTQRTLDHLGSTTYRSFEDFPLFR